MVSPIRGRHRAVASGQPGFDWTDFEPFPSHFLGVSDFDTSDFDQIRTHLDWPSFFQKWEFTIGFPDVLDDDDWGDAARTLLRDANDLLTEWLAEGILSAEVVFGVWRASAQGDHVVVWPDNQLPVRLSFPRLPAPGGSTYCVADFMKPAATLKVGESDYVGGYAIWLNEAIQASIRNLAAKHDEYWSQVAIDLCVLYRTAVADYLHYRLRRFIWAYCHDDDLSNEEILAGMHQGIRVDMGGRECPDRSGQAKLLTLLGVDDRAFTSSDEGVDSLPVAMCGYFFAHPRSRNYPPDPDRTRPVLPDND